MDQPRARADRSYLDHAASSPLRPEAARAMTEVWAMAGNPSSRHGSGRAAKGLLEDARESIAEDLGADPAEVIFTSGGTEADTLAVLGSIGARPERPAYAVSAVEHPAIDGIAVPYRKRIELPVGQGGAGFGRVDPIAVADVAPRCSVVSVQWVNNETGIVQPLTDVVAAAHEGGAWIHTDAVQALDTMPVDFAALGLDLLSASGHKFGGPVGVGILLARREAELVPVGAGGGQERRVRSGTVPMVLAVGMAAALRSARADREQRHERDRRWRAQIVEAAVQLPEVEVRGLDGVEGGQQPSILNLGIGGAKSEDLLVLLDRAGIDSSAGAACQAGVQRDSHVLAALGIDQNRSGSVRLSWGWSTGQADIDRVCAALPDVVAKARAAGAKKVGF
ncbi:cysteine desulfurase family protein [Parenemella sanctibonifatiensis]|uniref:cysteine desulfurase n=1 Tax=Parenemella sanctibonifatiensis TaxID=2016505 RepID=A0A255EB24_9ACTN|nr:cysteine desulfurase family protein [Parenemella sanctibonifatiensis]OYN86695.1 aminotransferase [Parenemella sanctibonifatiensis]